MDKRISVVVPLVIFLVFILWPVRKVEAQIKVSTFRELRSACGNQGDEEIELLNDVAVEGPIVIQGNKKIDGRGHILERSKDKGKVYGGCLFLVQGGNCQWENVTVSGGGRNRNIVGKVFGRLVEVRQGSMMIGEKCFFCDNINDRLAVDGGGAIQIGSKGSCTMKAGEIRNNQNVSRGAGFLVEKGGALTVKGGSLRNNKVTGAGAVKNFDGRGGAIYSEGKVSIEGGTIAGNQANGYQEGENRYGGIGAAVYVASCSSLYVSGGAFRENRDDKKSPFWIKGNLTLAGRPVLERIYLSSGVSIRTDATFYPEEKVSVLPEKYKSGICVAKGTKTPFKLAAKKQYQLEKRRDGCYLVKIVQKPASTKKPEEKKAESKLPVSPSSSPTNREAETPTIFAKKSHFVFYVDEIVNRQVLLYGVKAEDCRGGDITEAVKIIGMENGVLSTNKTKRGELFYEVGDQRGVKIQKKVTYEIRKNRSPVIHTASRFLFVTEVQGYTKPQWKDLLLQGCALSDDCEKLSDLAESTEVEIPEMKEIRAGTWDAVVKVRDQYGHRFYMKKGEKRRYGKGAITSVKVSVTLVDYSELGQTEAGYIRSVEPDKGVAQEEEWSFTAEQVKKIQRFMDEREDPFNQSTNQEFLRLFVTCRRYEEDVGE
ncbi:MAG: hypothetical protein MR304_04865 [Eubacterium sp.]|nr:hypothetical protein [Eubacterium sp.]